MGMTWDLAEAGAADAKQTVLLLPGGLCSARSYAVLMAEPALARTRLVAATLPGHAGAPALPDFSTDAYAQAAAALAESVRADVVVGFSMGAMVTYEMVVSGGFDGPVVLLGSSLSAADEPAAARAIFRLSSVLGTLPAAALKKGAAAMVKKSALPPEQQQQLRADFARTDSGDLRRALRAYLRWLRRNDNPARRLGAAGLPTWVIHAEKGDGALTSEERAELQSYPQVHVITLPGSVDFLPIERSADIAAVIVEALAAASHARRSTET